MQEKTIFKKFNVKPNQDILQIPEIKETIQTALGTNALDNKQPIKIEVTTLLCDSPTEIEVRHQYGVSTYKQDVFMSAFFVPETYIAQIISSKATTGGMIITQRYE